MSFEEVETFCHLGEVLNSDDDHEQAVIAWLNLTRHGINLEN